MHTLATFIQHSIGSPSQKIRQKKVIKSIQIGNKELQLSLFADDMTLYIGNHTDSTKKSIRTNK